MADGICLVKTMLVLVLVLLFCGGCAIGRCSSQNAHESWTVAQQHALYNNAAIIQTPTARRQDIRYFLTALVSTDHIR
jgi:hypothetical protein